jgi:hypothetical protein
MDGRLVTKLLLHDLFEFVSETDLLFYSFVMPRFVIRNNYMHSFMSRLEY